MNFSDVLVLPRSTQPTLHGLFFIVIDHPVLLNNSSSYYGAINSFGFGGANAHLVLEGNTEFAQTFGELAEPSAVDSAASTPPNPEILCISAKNSVSLHGQCARLAAFLNDNQKVKVSFLALGSPFTSFYLRVCLSFCLDDFQLSDIAYTLNSRRQHYAERICVHGKTKQDIASRLLEFVQSGSASSSSSAGSSSPSGASSPSPSPPPSPISSPKATFNVASSAAVLLQGVASSSPHKAAFVFRQVLLSSLPFLANCLRLMSSL